jgi:hypothetical protein
MKILDFNMSAEYCSDWGYLEALREVAQNALDLDCEASYEIFNQAIVVQTFDTEIPLNCFTLGVSQKSDGSIGKYGEGLKLAMMILTRLETNPVIFTGKSKISGQFRTNEITREDTFCLVFEVLEYSSSDTIFTCDLLDSYKSEIQKKLTPFGSFLGKPEHFDVVGEGGDIYVNGLFVCRDKELTHSYNFAPDAIELNRDRNMVDGISTALAVGHGNYGDPKQVFDMLINEAKDVSLLEYYITPKMQTKIKNIFTYTYGDVPIVKTGQKVGGLSFGYSAYGVFKGAGIDTTPTPPDPNTPFNFLTTFAVDNKRFMRRDEQNNFEKLIHRSKGWRAADVF